ncbi:hypothetical protein A9Q68_00535 [Streptococcus bovimastitidis]|uniref:HTH-like domain-containing protein n=1 Tax=Streptococcus bovimastitidis TaxID=1856638 RepID=A0A1L8MMQ7_9STRE|nr:hypothetical protein A9Q68_00535 [Streptococcus bovimastitidis]
MEIDGVRISLRRIRRIMERLNLVFVYQKAAFIPYSTGKLDRQFNPEKLLEALITDLIYVPVAESTYRAFKIEFVNQETFHSLEE